MTDSAELWSETSNPRRNGEIGVGLLSSIGSAMRSLISTALLAFLAVGAVNRVAAQTEPTVIRATTAPSDTRRLGFDIRGVVRKLDVERGDAVKSGQLLMSLDDTEERARLDFANRRADVTQQVAEAEARVELSEVELAIRQRNFEQKVVNELDRCSREAQDLLLTYLDRLPPGRAFLGTSNLQLDLLTERFQTRFQAIKLMPPTTGELAELLCRHWPVPGQTAVQIAVGSGGCVRAALADLESWLDQHSQP